MSLFKALGLISRSKINTTRQESLLLNRKSLGLMQSSLLPINLLCRPPNHPKYLCQRLPRPQRTDHSRKPHAIPKCLSQYQYLDQPPWGPLWLERNQERRNTLMQMWQPLWQPNQGARHGRRSSQSRRTELPKMLPPSGLRT